jgi:hypothetical protein
MIREIYKRQNIKQTKTPTMSPKTKEDRVQRIQLIRRSNKTNVITKMMKINPHLYSEDSVAVKPIRPAPIDEHLDQSQKYERASVGIKPHTFRTVIQDIFHCLTITEDLAENEEYDDQPPVRPLREIMEATNTEWGDPHNADPGPGTMTDTAPGQEPGNRHQGDKLLYTYEKPDLGNILDQDQQNAQKRVNITSKGTRGPLHGQG